MASRTISLEYSSSEEELQAQPSRFNFGDLPNLTLPSPFQSDSSGCESPTSPGAALSSRPATPGTVTWELSRWSSPLFSSPLKPQMAHLVLPNLLGRKGI